MDPSYQVTVKTALENPATLATVLYHLIRKEYGDAAFDWDPATIYLELRERFNCEPATEVMDRISAIQVLVTTGVFFERVDAFVNIANTLASGQPSFQVFDVATAEECAWALSEVSLIRDMLPLSYGVRGYLKQILQEDGYDLADLPPVFADNITPVEALQRANAHIAAGNEGALMEFVQDQLQMLVEQADRIPGMAEMIATDPEASNVPTANW